MGWHERFLVPLPTALCDQLVAPAAGAPENREAWAGVPLTLRFLVADHQRPAAPLCAAASAGVEYDWLVNQVARMRIVASAREAAAKEVCMRCPVRAECATHALAVREPYGVWGGLTEDEREEMMGRSRHRLLSPQ